MLIPEVAELQEIVRTKEFPLTISWSRLEGRPFSDNYDRALRAEVRDSLWMLSKQWQMGEFEGDDAGSPVTARICTVSAALNKYRADSQTVQAFDNDVPFEAKVEQRPLPFTTLTTEISLDLRLLLGRRWFQLLSKRNLLSATRKFFLDHYGFKKPNPESKTDAVICAHPEVWSQIAAVTGRMLDGFLFLSGLDAATHYYDRPDFPLPGSKGEFDAAEIDFKNWYKSLFYQPTEPENNAWLPSNLEYQFSISAKTEKGETVMTADEYYQGHLDWYNMDINPAATLDQLAKDESPDPLKIVQTLIPAPVMFQGMPNTRWWAFEDSKTNFSYIKPDPTDLSKLLLIEFGLIYANDWFLIPFRIPVASLTTIKGLSVTNSFGENFWIDAAGKGDDKDWTRWNMFSMNVTTKDPVPAITDLLLLPTVAKIQEGNPIEEVVFIRDEIANMVWGIETVIPLPGSWSKSGFESAAEYHAFLQKLVDDSGIHPVPLPPVKDGEEEAKIRYQIMNSIPENWIPFIPVHLTNNDREVQLQRAAMPRILQGDPEKPVKVRPRTTLLQPGLAEKFAYYIHEEEVPRSGIRVEQSFQRTRWNDGRIYVWFGMQKKTGRGEGSSGLGFDMILPKTDKE